MSGIAGVLNSGRAVGDARDVAAGGIAASPYLSDKEIDTWSDGAVVLFRDRFSTSGASSHGIYARDGLVLCADARLDGKDDLRRALSAEGKDLASSRDEELILVAYEAWGVECARRLLGDFAFVVWD